MWLGYPRGIHSMSLKSACETYLNGVHLNKEIRGRILWEGIVPEVIQYAAGDVTYLEDIMKCQLQKLQEKDLETACKIENKYR